jgi:spermidine synthase
MKPWVTLATATMPGGAELELLRHDGVYVIRAEGRELMVSHAHDSEDAMMALALPHPRAGARVLVGGLGMGFTLRAALTLLPGQASVTVAELVPEVIEWNRGPLGPLAGYPLDDPRTELFSGDVRQVIEADRGRFDAILLDIDNGPDASSSHENWLYMPEGLAATVRALRSGGAVAVWSVDGSPAFERRLRSAGLVSSSHMVHGHRGRGTRYVVFIGRKS